MHRPFREIRAAYDPETITVYQAYPPAIAEPAAASGRFPDWYNRNRMTWIKPSFLWMMYRSGWATKPGQERVLAIRMRREGLEWALWHSALSHYDRDLHADRQVWQDTLRMPVRVQWDPERDIHLSPLPYRAIQIGLSGEAVHRFVDDWIVGITDVTELTHRVHAGVGARHLAAAQRLLPAEQRYSLAEELARQVGASAIFESQG